jgi:hypothetical protein
MTVNRCRACKPTVPDGRTAGGSGCDSLSTVEASRVLALGMRRIRYVNGMQES